MPSIVQAHNIGAFVAVATSVRPQDASAGAIDGVAIDRMAHGMPLSCVLHQEVGADSGSPTSFTVTSQLQHSPDNSTWANYTDPDTGVTAATAALTATTSENSVAIDLSVANRYIRVVTTVAFTGGTSPAAQVGAQLVLGGEPENPAT